MEDVIRSAPFDICSMCRNLIRHQQLLKYEIYSENDEP